MRQSILLITLFTSLFVTAFPVLASDPTSDNFKLSDYNFGAGGGSASSDDYSIHGALGEVEFGSGESDSFKLGQGLAITMTKNVPPAPSLTNTSNWYDKLKLILNTSNNPSDTVFAVAISTDDFTTDTRYVQDDHTIDTVLGSEDWQSYSDWGNGTGIEILGLEPGITYTVKVSARQGDFTQSAYGPTAQATTSNPTITFDIDISSVDEETSAPYTVDMGTLSIGSVSTAPDKIWVDFSTNALNGGYVYVYDAYAGLQSDSVSYTIQSVSGNLIGENEGYGIRSDTITQSSGGPFTAQAPYNGTNDVVGIVDTQVREILHSSNNPIAGGRASILIKAKTASSTPASSDYVDTLTIIASGSF